MPTHYTVNVTIENGAEEGALQFGVNVNGTIERTANVALGTNASVELRLPQAGWAFMGWWDGNDTISRANPFNYTGQANITLVALMKPWRPCSEADETPDFFSNPLPGNFDHYNPELDPVVVTNVEVVVENGQIVVSESYGLDVTLFDVNGRVLATKSDATQPVRFDVPVSGSYMVKVANLVTRKVVVIR